MELPPEVQTVVLAPDNDEAGHKAIEKAEATMTGVGVKRLLSPAGKDCLGFPAPRDWCDVLEAFDERAGIRQFDGGVDRQTAEDMAIVEVRP